MRGLIAILATTLLAAGCAEAPQRSLAPAALPTPPPDHALLVVYREGISPYRRAVTISVNGIDAGEVDADEFTLIQVPPGHAHIKSRWGFDIPFPSGFADLDLQAGKTYYFEVILPTDTMGAIGLTPWALEGLAPGSVPPAVLAGGMALVIVDQVPVWISGKALVPEAADEATGRLSACCKYLAPDQGFTLLGYTAPADRTAD